MAACNHGWREGLGAGGRGSPGASRCSTLSEQSLMWYLAAHFKWSLSATNPHSSLPTITAKSQKRRSSMQDSRSRESRSSQTTIGVMRLDPLSKAELRRSIAHSSGEGVEQCKTLTPPPSASKGAFAHHRASAAVHSCSTRVSTHT